MSLHSNIESVQPCVVLAGAVGPFFHIFHYNETGRFILRKIETA